MSYSIGPAACAVPGLPAALGELWERLGRGEHVDPAEYYLRGQPMYETAEADNPYSWLNRIVAVSVGCQEKLGVTYDVHKIL